jgi:hypothetical protein
MIVRRAPKLLVGVVLILASCSTVPPMPVPSASHPASPQAVELPAPASSAILQPEPEAASTLPPPPKEPGATPKGHGGNR